MAVASGNGVQIHDDQLPVSHTVQQICNHFEIDFRYVIGAGSMVMAVKAAHADSVLKRLGGRNIDAIIIGKFTAKEKGYQLIKDGLAGPLPYYPNDPYWKAFYNAVKKGWK